MILNELTEGILTKKLTEFDVVNYIEKNSTESSRKLLLNSIYKHFFSLSCDFMLKVEEEEIIEAFTYNANNFEYAYLGKEDLLRFKHFIRVIDKKQTVFNISGFSKEEKEGAIKVIFLNNLMIKHHDGFLFDEIEGFENLSYYKSVCDFLKETFSEQVTEILEETNEIYDLLDTIRTKDHTDLQLYDIVKERTQLNKDALQYLYKDIEVYLFGEKDDFECKYSEDETEQAIEDLKAKGHTEDDLIMLGYIRKSKAFNVATNNMNLDFTYINKEKIFFPLEFLPIYQLQGLINAELSKIKEKEELLNPDIKITPKLKTDLSVPQLSLVFKMINDLKPKVFNTKSDAELFRFISANFQTKKSTEKGISTQKLRNEFNNPDLKAIEFWEKHLHTMLSELRKLK